VNPTNFLAELKRRSVYKTAIAYGVVAWLLIQVATQVFPFFEIPNWTVRLVVLLAVIGFPIALVIAWAFELTPEGLKRTEVADAAHEHSRGRTWIYVVVIGGLISIGLFSLGRYTAGTSKAQLGVATVLEGSVQKAGNRVRIIVQLIDAQNDAYLWSETYDRELKDIFSVESEVAQNIAGALKAKLTPEAAQSLEQVPTRDAEAYNLYLKAGYYVREATDGNSDPAIVLPTALDLYAQAIAKDPSFALAWAQASYVHSWMHWFGVDDSPAQMQLAEDAARRALALNPQLPEAHVALGYVATGANVITPRRSPNSSKRARRFQIILQ